MNTLLSTVLRWRADPFSRREVLEFALQLARRCPPKFGQVQVTPEGDLVAPGMPVRTVEHFQELARALLGCLEKRGQDTAHLQWVLLRRRASLQEVVEALERELEDLPPLCPTPVREDDFEVPWQPASSGFWRTFWRQNPLRLTAQLLGLAVVTLAVVVALFRPAPPVGPGTLYVAVGRELITLDTRTGLRSTRLHRSRPITAVASLDLAGHVVLAEEGSRRLAVVDVVRAQVESELRLEGVPSVLTRDPRFLYVGFEDVPAVAVVEANTMRLVRMLPAAREVRSVGIFPGGLAALALDRLFLYTLEPLELKSVAPAPPASAMLGTSEGLWLFEEGWASLRGTERRVEIPGTVSAAIEHDGSVWVVLPERRSVLKIGGPEYFFKSPPKGVCGREGIVHQDESF